LETSRLCLGSNQQRGEEEEEEEEEEEGSGEQIRGMVVRVIQIHQTQALEEVF
jgi:hypothetical protein